MDLFPAADPIPLPAPVWLFKVLHDATLALHFIAVYFLVGGLFWTLAWHLKAKITRNEADAGAARALAQRIPIVMAYVINLGVPPLLFAQVLYGRALYTSSVLIGVWWIAVIALLIILYSLLYWAAHRAEDGKGIGIAVLLALLIALKIGYIYSSNMTLMLRPEVWREMYRASPQGLALPTGDPTLLPRWLSMMTAACWLGGLLMLLLGMKQSLGEATSKTLRKGGAAVLALLALPQLALGYWVYAAQADEVRTALAHAPFSVTGAALWVLSAVLVALMAGLCLAGGATRCWKRTTIIAGCTLVHVLSLVLFRDTLRDITLNLKGFNVWEQNTVTNWSTVGLFLLLFVIALVAAGWLASVALRVKETHEDYV